MTIFELVKAPEISAYWTTLANQRATYLGETLSPIERSVASI